MDRIPVFVGLDYHQLSVQVCVVDGDGCVLFNRSCANDWLAIQRSAEGFGSVAGAAIESCTGAADLAEELVGQAGWSVDLAHPGYVSRMKQNPDKHDLGDAHLLADLERVGYVPRVWLAPADVRELRRLVRYRQHLVDERRDLKLRIRALLRDQRVGVAPARAWTQRWLGWLRGQEDLSVQSRWIVGRHLKWIEQFTEEIEAVEKRLGELTDGDALVEHLCKQPGIGAVTAWMLRAEIGRFDRFRSGKQLSRFCGLSPRNASSGNRQADAGLIKAGNKFLRATLIEAAHRLARHDPRWRGLAQSMRERGKPGSVIAAAIANRWVRWLFHQMRPCEAA